MIKMTEIIKKVLPKYFREIKKGKKSFEVRLADFKIKPGDTLILKECKPKTKELTGKVISKKVEFVTKFNPLEFNKLNDIKKYSMYGIVIK